MKNKLDSLLSNCTSGGCGAKIGASDLSDLLKGLPLFYDKNLSVGYNSSDDAAVYKLNDSISVISTVDFFPPMVDNPKIFGKIAAANALSDVYAMGGQPIMALNLVCFPQSMDLSILGEILSGGAEKILEAQAVLSGGHSIYDKEPKYGLSVTGIVENDRILRNDTPHLGDMLILTKPLGTGIIMAANRVGEASDKAFESAIKSMERLNKYAAEKLKGFEVSACTDITGFGLLGHVLEMAGENVSIKLSPLNLPYIEEAYKYADEFLVTAAGQRNRNHLGNKCNVDSLPFALQELMFDPQTSGGLLIAVNPRQSEELLSLIKSDDAYAKIIGEVVPRENNIILF